MTKAFPKFGFVGWNPFQLLHVRDLIEALPGSCFVLELRKNFIDEFDESLLNDPRVPVLVWDRSRMAELDGMFDVIVCQTPFTRIDALKKSKIAMIQYGYAKEPHNYGPWRSLADLTLVYGDYAARKISAFCPAVATGNPRYDQWHKPELHEAARAVLGPRLDPRRKTVLYAPTWGDLSSVDTFLPAVYELAEEFNLLVKMHHNTELLEPGRRDAMSRRSVSHFGANDDLLKLLSISDAVISDYSGAIFDAIFCRKPMILLDTLDGQGASAKLDEYSIEYARREELGTVVSHPRELHGTVRRVLNNPGALVVRVEPLRRDLFVDEPEATQRACAALLSLAETVPQQAQAHAYVRKHMLELMQVKAQLAAAKKKIKALSA